MPFFTMPLPEGSCAADDGTTGNTVPDKSALRKAAFAERHRTTPAQRMRAGARLANEAMRQHLFDGVHRVALYESFGTEIDSQPLIALARQAGCRVLLPSVGERLEVGWHWQGSEHVLPSGELAGCALIIVPALTMDRAGNRLGRGAGWYDRALVHADEDARIVAVCWDWELQDKLLPRASHDRPVDAVLTAR